MERLTTDAQLGDKTIGSCNGDSLICETHRCGDCPHCVLMVNKLAEYERIGTPEELKNLQKADGHRQLLEEHLETLCSEAKGAFFNSAAGYTRSIIETIEYLDSSSSGKTKGTVSFQKITAEEMRKGIQKMFDRDMSGYKLKIR